MSREQPNSILFAEQPIDDLSCGVADDVSCASVALRHRRHEGSGLLERDVRRQRRHFRIGLHLQHDRPIAGERFVPRRGQTIGESTKMPLNPIISPNFA